MLIGGAKVRGEKDVFLGLPRSHSS